MKDNDVVINGTTYFQSAHQIAFEKCPNGFEYGGVVESGIAEGHSCYINPQMPEWIYIAQDAKRIGTVDNFYLGFVRYVDESIRGKDLINYNGMIYVSMFSAEYPFVVDKTLYDEIENTYGRIVEDSKIDGFFPVGITAFLITTMPNMKMRKCLNITDGILAHPIYLPMNQAIP